MLELKNITKIYNPGEITESCLFRDFSLSVEAGEFVSVVGSNGSGKTSLLNIICGSIPIQSGDVIIDGESMLHKKEFVRYRRFGRVYQNPALGTSPNLTMFENLSLADNKGKAYGLGRGVNHPHRAAYREQLAALGLGLEDKMDIKMGALSGGQRQAVAVRLVDKISGDADLLVALEQRGHAERRNKQREHGHYPPRRIAEYERDIYIHESTSDKYND